MINFIKKIFFLKSSKSSLYPPSPSQLKEIAKRTRPPSPSQLKEMAKNKK
jgi:hypothetical protein